MRIERRVGDASARFWRCGHADVDEAFQPVGPIREHGGQARTHCHQRGAILCLPLLISLERSDPQPLISSGNAGSQGTPRLEARRGVAPRLSQDTATTKHTLSAALPLLSPGPLDVRDSLSQLGKKRILALEVIRKLEDELERRRHRTVCPEEVPRPMCTYRPACQKCVNKRRPWPVMDAFDKSILHGVRRDVDQLVQQVARRNNLDNARLFGRPQVLPAATEGVLRLREELVEVLAKLGFAPIRVIDRGVVVIRLHLREHDIEPTPLRSLCEAVGEGVIRFLVGSQQKLSLGTPACDEQEPSWEHRAWRCHRVRQRSRNPASASSRELARFAATSSDVRTICGRPSDRAGHASGPRLTANHQPRWGVTPVGSHPQRTINPGGESRWGVTQRTINPGAESAGGESARS